MELSDEHERYLEQNVTIPTRKNNILDLVFSSADLVSNVSCTVNSVISDHNKVNLTFGYDTDPRNKTKENTIQLSDISVPEIETLDFHAADEHDWSRVNQLLSKTNWEEELKDLNTTETLEFIMNKLTYATSIFIPKLKGKEDDSIFEISKGKKPKNKIPRVIRTMFRKKSKISKKILISKEVSEVHKLNCELTKVESNLKNEYDNWRSIKENQVINTISTNPKAFYKYANKKSKIKSVIGPLKNKENEPITDTTEIAKILSDQFSSVFMAPLEEYKVNNLENFFNTEATIDSLHNVVIDREDVKEAIEELKASASKGPDGVPASLLKRCKQEVAIPLTILYNKSIEEGVVPDKLKLAHIIPIHKGKEKSLPVNYRPVSLTSHLSKTLERVMRKRIVNHLEKTNYFIENQHGFRNRRSCLSQLIKHYDEVLSAVEQGENCDVIYLDFSKAFHKVDHNLLNHRLLEANIKGKVGLWLSDFLSNRKQKVKVGESLSEEVDVTSGVPEGTPLGPILFLLLINNIDEEVDEAKVSLFADDTRIMKSIEKEEDSETLQQELNKLYVWQKKSNMVFNEDKFELMQFGKNDDLKNSLYFTPDFKEMIERKQTVKDLGVLFDEDLSFNSHVNKIHKTVSSKIGWVLRSFQCRETKLMKTIWKSLIQPHIDYCSPLWFSPNSQGEITRLENLQRQFTKKIKGFENLNYWERLNKLKMLSHQRRMERYNIIYTWKVLEGLVPDCGLEEICSERRGRLCKVRPIVSNSTMRVRSIRENSFQISGPNLFNSLPAFLRGMTGCTIENFKESLDSFIQMVPDEPKCENLEPRSICIHNARSSNSLVDQLRNMNF